MPMRRPWSWKEILPSTSRVYDHVQPGAQQTALKLRKQAIKYARMRELVLWR
jgi:hypothetical protein